MVTITTATATNAMAFERFWVQTPTLQRIAGIMDKGFLVCAALIPMMKAAYLVYLRGDDLDVVRITPHCTHAS